MLVCNIYCMVQVFKGRHPLLCADGSHTICGHGTTINGGVMAQQFPYLQVPMLAVVDPLQEKCGLLLENDKVEMLLSHASFKQFFLPASDLWMPPCGSVFLIECPDHES